MDRWKCTARKKLRHADNQKVGDLGKPVICGSGASKSRLAKAASEEPAGQMRDEKVHAVVARSTKGTEHVKSNRRSEHFLTI